MSNSYYVPFTPSGASTSAHSHVGHSGFSQIGSQQQAYRGSNVLDAYNPAKMQEREANDYILTQGMTLDEEFAYLASRFPHKPEHALKQGSQASCANYCPVCCDRSKRCCPNHQ